MDQQQQEQTESLILAEGKAEWTRPEVERLIAGGAESGGDTSVDGVDILS